MRVLAALFAVGASLASAPFAGAGDHETVGGGTFTVSNSNGPCTTFEAAHTLMTACAGQSVAVPFTKYIVVPLGNASWVGCETYAPNGQLFERDEEYLAEVPRMQQFWNEKGWGIYEPMAMCQMW